MKKYLDTLPLERYKNRKLLVKNKVSFLGPDSELSIYGAYRKADSIVTVIDYLKHNITKPFDIGQLTQEACMSRSALYTAFKHRVGCTPCDFYWQLRLKMAADMLHKGQSVTTVCYSVGFSDPSHFSRRFNQFYGCTPSQYQKIKQIPN